MPSAVESLMEMGFSKEKAELAVSKTGSEDVGAIMDWILSHEDELEALTTTNNTQEPSTVETTSNENSNTEDPSDLVAKSIKCEDCGKLFKNNDEVQFHAVKSGHENFTESTEEKTPLSEQEKEEQVAKIREKLKQRRLEREAREKQDELERERNRIKSGKEMLEAKKKYEDIEMKKILEQRKREKEEERMARQRVKEQIEQDKLARKAMFGGSPVQEKKEEPQVQQRVAKTVNYSEVKLQIRLTNGSLLTQTFGAKEPLSAVRLYIEVNRNDADGPFNLMTNFPKKVFQLEDYDKPLDALGLAPSAVLIVSKSV